MKSVEGCLTLDGETAPSLRPGVERHLIVLEPVVNAARCRQLEEIQFTIAFESLYEGQFTDYSD